MFLTVLTRWSHCCGPVNSSGWLEEKLIGVCYYDMKATKTNWFLKVSTERSVSKWLKKKGVELLERNNTFNNYISYLSGNCCLSQIFRMNVVEIPLYCFTNYKSNFRYHAPKFMQIYSKQYSLHTFMKCLKDEVRFISKVL